MTPTHPVTGAVLVRGTRLITIRFRNISRVIDMPGWYADDDLTGENGLHDPEDMRVSDQALAEMVAGIGHAEDGDQTGGA